MWHLLLCTSLPRTTPQPSFYTFAPLPHGLWLIPISVLVVEEFSTPGAANMCCLPTTITSDYFIPFCIYRGDRHKNRQVLALFGSFRVLGRRQDSSGQQFWRCIITPHLPCCTFASCHSWHVLFFPRFHIHCLFLLPAPPNPLTSLSIRQLPCLPSHLLAHFVG